MFGLITANLANLTTKDKYTILGLFFFCEYCVSDTFIFTQCELYIAIAQPWRPYWQTTGPIGNEMDLGKPPRRSLRVVP